MCRHMSWIQLVWSSPEKKIPAHVEKLMGTTGRLEFRLIPMEMTVATNKDENGNTTGVTVTDRGRLLTDAEVINTSYLVVSGSDLKPNSGVTYDQAHRPAVSFSMTDGPSRQRFAIITGTHINENLAIVLDNKIITAPVIKDAIPGDGIIAGGFPTLEIAKDLATLLNAGALPVPVQIVESRVVSPAKK